MISSDLQVQAGLGFSREVMHSDVDSRWCSAGGAQRAGGGSPGLFDYSVRREGPLAATVLLRPRVAW